MKVLITKKQYKIILEQSVIGAPNYGMVDPTPKTSDEPKTKKRVITDPIEILYQQIVDATRGFGTNVNNVYNAISKLKNMQEFIKLNKFFTDKKSGYSSFSEMINGEYDASNYDDVRNIQKKLHTIGVYTAFKSLGSLFGKDFKITGYFNPNTPKLTNEVISQWNNNLGPAINYWKSWLGSPKTKEKFRSNWKPINPHMATEGNTERIFKSYFDALSKLKLVFFDDSMIYEKETGFDVSNKRKAVAFVSNKFPKHIFINGSKNDNEKLETLIHEIQHILYDIFPLNPKVKVRDAFVTKETQKTGPINIFGNLSDDTNSKYEAISQKLGVGVNRLSYLKKTADNIKHSDPNYVCSENEKLSNIYAVRRLFNIQPHQNITYQMIEPYIKGTKKHGDVYWILMCWAKNDFKNINELLAGINGLAKVQTQKNTNLA